MTMVAGARLVDGVLIAADCRITWETPKGFLHTDDAQKLIRVGDSTVLGYAGHLTTVNYLLPHIYATLRQPRRRGDAIAVRRWLPRFLARAYRALARHRSIDQVHFMAAGSIKGRLARLDRDLLWETIEQTHTLQVNNWLAVRCLDQFTNSHEQTLTVPDSSEGLLYVMSSPEFKPKDVPPLGVQAIGSGRAAADVLQTYRPLIMCAHPDRAPDMFSDALSGYFVEHGLSTVGGMLMISHAFNGGVTSLLLSGGDKQIEAKRDGAYFHVRNNATGKEIRLKYPSELLRVPPRNPVLFDDFTEAMEADRERMRSLREEIVHRLGQIRVQKSGE
jgi:hypothetical protein